MKFKAGLQHINGAQNSHFKKLPNSGGGGILTFPLHQLDPPISGGSRNFKTGGAVPAR